MTTPDPLAQLHPLREPAAIGWWPPAPGWWLLAGLALVLLLVLGWLAWKRWRGNGYRRQALRQLEAIALEPDAREDPQVFATRVNALLKSVALRAWPGPEVAACSGEHWLLFLNEKSGCKQLPGFSTDFLAALYGPGGDAFDEQQLLRASRDWIRQHRGPA